MASLNENITQAINDFDSIEKTIEDLGVDIPSGTPTSKYGEKISELYEKSFWDKYQDKGKRTDYAFAFSSIYWTQDNFTPKYDIRPINARYLFNANNNFVNLKKCFDDNGVVLDLSKATSVFGLFGACKNLEEVGVIDISSVTEINNGIGDIFANTTKLKTVERFKLPPFSAGSTFNNRPFYRALALQNITFDGIINCNGFTVQWSPLTHDSLISLLNILEDKSSDMSGTDWVITVGPNNLNKLTNDDISIANNKGWRVV